MKKLVHVTSAIQLWDRHDRVAVFLNKDLAKKRVRLYDPLGGTVKLNAQTGHQAAETLEIANHDFVTPPYNTYKMHFRIQESLLASVKSTILEWTAFNSATMDVQSLLCDKAHIFERSYLLPRMKAYLPGTLTLSYVGYKEAEFYSTRYFTWVYRLNFPDNKTGEAIYERILVAENPKLRFVEKKEIVRGIDRDGNKLSPTCRFLLP
ncbi:MAG TPA: hypothetical protein VK502_01165 [Candidatus Saccharimonadales bacterium]|nr:hypothetical protein [Candidatus Saccharimonadales bacterium]